MWWALTLVTVVALVAGNQLPGAEPCDEDKCKLPDCRCSSSSIPGDFRLADVPQFVLLSFDTAISVNNEPTYRELLFGRKNSNKCPIGVSFYVSHEYTNYRFVNDFYNEGFEIGLNSITYGDQAYFQNADLNRMMQEFADQKTQIAHFAAIPEASIEGMRIPYLQMAGNYSFQMMKAAGLKYDFSWPTTLYTNPGLWPYTLEYASIQDCIAPPCPNASFVGAWVVPIITWTDLFGFPCATVDACFSLPADDDEDGWFRFMVQNFERHYLSNRAPFNFNIQEGTLRTRPGLKAAFIRFLDMINSMSDVFMVNASEVLNWVQKPVPLGEYINQPCRVVVPERCRGFSCGPLEAPHKEELFYLQTCAACPANYPWLGNPLGR